jgi:hypothetical protein
LKRGYLSSPKGASAALQVWWKCRASSSKAVDGRQVHAAAEPAHRRLARRGGRDHAHIHVDGGHIGVARVEDQRYAHGFERRACEFGAVLCGRWRQLRPAHVREAAAGAFEHLAPPSRIMVMPWPCSFSPGGFSQASAQERGAVERGDLGADLALQVP